MKYFLKTILFKASERCWDSEALAGEGAEEVKTGAQGPLGGLEDAGTEDAGVLQLRSGPSEGDQLTPDQGAGPSHTCSICSVRGEDSRLPRRHPHHRSPQLLVHDAGIN